MSEGFLPSRHGFAFDNAWPAQPAVVVSTPFGKVPFGSANAGLCGGMTFAALDYWHAGKPPPADRPPLGTPLYSFIVRRLLESWRLPGGVARYYDWMGMSDSDGGGLHLFGRPVLPRRGIGSRTRSGEWPHVRSSLDRGAPVTLGVITVASRRPRDLIHNHQVLAYGYRLSGDQVTLRVYDPNRAGRDDIAIVFTTGQTTGRTTGKPTDKTTFTHNLGIGRSPVRGFFRTRYRPSRSLPA